MTWIGYLISSGVAGILLGHLLTRTKFVSEVSKIKAETDKIYSDIQKSHTETISSWMKIAKELRTDVENLTLQLDDTRRNNKALSDQVEGLAKENQNLKLEMRNLETLLKKKKEQWT